VLAPLRELSALVLVGVTGALLLLYVLELFASLLDNASFSDRATAEFGLFVGLPTIFLPLIAVLLVTLIKPNTPRAGLITMVSVVEYGVAAIFGLVCLFAAFIETVSRDVDGSIVDAFLDLLVGLVWLVLLGFAAFVVFRVYQGVYYVAKPKPVALGGGYPQGYPPAGYPQGYPQQAPGYPQQGQPGYPSQAAYQAAYGPSGSYPAVPQPGNPQQPGGQPAGPQPAYQAQPVQQPGQPGGYPQQAAAGYPAAAYQNPGYQASGYPAAAGQPPSGTPAPSSPVPSWTTPGAGAPASSQAPTSAPPSPPSPPAPPSAPLAYQADPSASQPSAGTAESDGLEDESARTQLIPSGGSAPAATPATDSPGDSGEPTQVSMTPVTTGSEEHDAAKPAPPADPKPEDGEEPTQAWRG
jgi:hypothetical protein